MLYTVMKVQRVDDFLCLELTKTATFEMSA